VREDDEVPGLLYAGTEFGAFVSFDDGQHWQPLQLNLPATPVTDMKVHRGDLALSTQGRSFWILDDLSPLRGLAQTTAPGPVHLFAPRAVARGIASPPMSEMDLNLPDPLPQGAFLNYTMVREVSGLSMAIFDGSGDTVAVWSGGGRGRLPADPGFHRIVWPLRYQTRGGVKAPPGEYAVRLSWDGGSQEESLTVSPNPRTPEITQADYLEQFRVTTEVYESSREVREALDAMDSVLEQARGLLARARGAGREVGSLPEGLRGLEGSLLPLKGELTNVDDPHVEVAKAPPEGAGLSQDFGTLFNYLNGGGGYGGGSVEGRPTQGAMNRKADLEALWAELKPRVDLALEEGVAAFNAEVERLGLEGIILPRPGG
jgi:hypothetical protein